VAGRAMLILVAAAVHVVAMARLFSLLGSAISIVSHHGGSFLRPTSRLHPRLPSLSRMTIPP
jgi:hypothetical protein